MMCRRPLNIPFWMVAYGGSTVFNIPFLSNIRQITSRGGEWYLEKRGSRKILVGSRNLESVLISLEVSFLHGLFLLFLSLETFYQRVSGSGF